MAATITNYPDKPTVGYAELWSADAFVFVANDWWPHASLCSEDKGDERDIGARYKCDIAGRCWVTWQGTSDGQRLLQVQQAADGHPLDNPPGTAFLPIEAGVNLITFGEEPEPPEPEPPAPVPEPQPEPPPQPEPEPPDVPGLPDDWVPNSIHIYYGGIHDTPVVSYYVGAKFVTLGIQREHYLKLWKGLEQELTEAIHG